MEQQVSALCESCGHQIHMIGEIVKFLTPRATEQLVHSFVTSRLDNWVYQTNSFTVYNFFSIEQHDSSHIPRNMTRSHLRSLYWLPVRSRIIFKILLLVYKSIHVLVPAYLSELIKPYAPESNQRSGMKSRLIEPRTRLVTFSDRAFYKAGPTLWNKLPPPPPHHFKSNTL